MGANMVMERNKVISTVTPQDNTWNSLPVAELERKIGQQALEIDFLKRALQRVEEQRQLRALAGGARSTNKSNGKSQRDEV